MEFDNNGAPVDIGDTDLDGNTADVVTSEAELVPIAAEFDSGGVAHSNKEFEPSLWEPLAVMLRLIRITGKQRRFDVGLLNPSPTVLGTEQNAGDTLVVERSESGDWRLTAGEAKADWLILVGVIADWLLITGEIEADWLILVDEKDDWLLLIDELEADSLLEETTTDDWFR